MNNNSHSACNRIGCRLQGEERDGMRRSSPGARVSIVIRRFSWWFRRHRLKKW